MNTTPTTEIQALRALFNQVKRLRTMSLIDEDYAVVMHDLDKAYGDADRLRAEALTKIRIKNGLHAKANKHPGVNIDSIHHQSDETPSNEPPQTTTVTYTGDLAYNAFLKPTKKPECEKCNRNGQVMFKDEFGNLRGVADCECEKAPK